MRHCWAFGVVVLSLSAATPATAQTFSVAPTEQPAPTGLGQGADSVDFRPAALPATVSGAWSLDFLLGLPTGLRVQRTVGDAGVWQVEGFFGLEVFYPTSGLGMRRRFGPFGDNHDALFISPGFDAYMLYNVSRHGGGLFGGGPEYWGILAADVELTWQHCWTERWQGEAGLKLGAGVISGSRVLPVPVIGIFAGWRF